ncbi:hypothetical protein [Bremerella alba]|uniref:Carboxypeptidase regulatory-like domain-containing protein n=1 Tax=Bremerella alba TaxID=980252 RepID=A0A7V9A7E2_9BACT|nr:hypothetical protein [Bremerella alba]MBA2115262.1 hypothetical protein [Bremerella alba]
MISKRQPCFSPKLVYLGTLSLAVFTLGCSDVPTGDIVPTSPAAGVAKYQGKPLEYYQIQFIPEEGRPAAGITDENGNFTLGTNDVGDGAPSGSHRVAVTYVGPPPPPDYGVTNFDPIPPPKFKIPAKFNDPKRSGIVVEVPEAGKTDLLIELN